MDQNEEAARQPPRSSPTAQQQSLRKPPPSPASRQHARDAENRSLDFVQRMVISALIIVVFGLFAGTLAAYLALNPDESDRGSTIGLWVMTGVFGLATAAAVLIVNRRRPYSPWVLLGLLPMAISAFWVL